MSLVHDALQKAEREKLCKTGPLSGGSAIPAATPVPVAPRMALPQTAPTPAPRSHQSAVLVSLGVLVVIVLGGVLWFVLRPKPVVEGAVPAAPSAVTKEAATARQEPRPPAESQPPPALATDDPAYKLTGIMKDPDGKPCAIVNGRVVSEGHYVDGATVKSIEKDRVTLDVNGREVVKRLY